MGCIMQKLTITERLAIVAVLPILGLILAIALFMRDRADDLERANVLIPFTELAGVTATLVHEIQKERGASVGFLTARGEGEFRTQLGAQRPLTDAQMRAFRERLAGVTSISSLDASHPLRVRMGEIERALEVVVARR